MLIYIFNFCIKAALFTQSLKHGNPPLGLHLAIHRDDSLTYPFTTEIYK